MHGFEIDLLPVCALSMPIVRRESPGETAEGIYVTGFLGEGTVAGERLNGVVVAGAADWALIRRDGMLTIDVKLLARLDDGNTIRMDYSGLVDMGADAYVRLAQGERSHIPYVPRSCLRMMSAAGPHEWVNRELFVGVGRLDYDGGLGAVRYDIHQIRAGVGGDERRNA